MAKKSRRELYYQLPKNIGLEELTDSEAGEVWKALDRYGGTREQLRTALMRVIYNRCCDCIDADNDAFERAIEKKRKASQTRWGKNNGMQCNAMDSNGEQRNSPKCNGMQCNAMDSNGEQRNSPKCHTPTLTPTPTLTLTQEPKPSLSEDNDSGNMMMITSADASNIIIDELFKDEWIYEASERLMIPNDEVKAGLKSIASQIVNEGNTYKSRGELMHHIDAWLRKAKRIKAEDNAKMNRYTTNNQKGKDNGDRDKFRGIDAVHHDPNEYDEDF